MSNWSRVLAALARGADAWADRERDRRRKRRRASRGAHVLPYLGFGTPARLQLAGRVLWGSPSPPAHSTDTPLRNLVQFYRRMASDEVPGARLQARYGDCRRDVAADAEGYFEVECELSPPIASDGGLHAVELRLMHPLPGTHGDAITAPVQGLVMVPAARARFGVISDIDDTVVQTHVRQRLRMLLALARGNALTREPFEGVAALYRALQAGAGGDDGNPLFYVSSSPWNLYAPLVQYLEAQHIPLGPLLLKDYGDHTLFALRDHHSHKQASIERLFETYPRLSFVLVGDSGEQDPEIYTELAERHPGRVLAIYIRTVHPDEKRRATLHALADRLRRQGVPLVLAADSAAAAAHAAEAGLIATPRLAA